ncbi:stage II sporulation protein P [Aquibacillus sp. 3ASR75-11]|uniref:Stage II sporulation protein P n=1 Tax=Terrihalobacillus insolitus TaxID=2950438 RepID=A0A9X4AM03_9BACI|nr:stage II sporulation protein P [Terrihalobacillus insolitus]MDC3413329.1 stage II sporulation protein P [Terrihalobacillus insolitus]MDC3424912.1 stage II sporulation protein P [Terrihalobacillus insolitus]
MKKNKNKSTFSFHIFSQNLKPLYKRGTLLILSVTVLFFLIGILTTVKPAYRLSSNTINEWTRQIQGSSFFYLLGFENRLFMKAFPGDIEPLNLSEVTFQLVTSLKPSDPRSLLGRELPGFYENSKIVVAGEGTTYQTLPIESAAPLDVVLEDRAATVPDEEELAGNDQNKESKDQPTTDGKDVVYIYNTHNRESFLPYLPEGTTPDEAHSAEVNITNVSDRLAQSLEDNGIGSSVSNSDIMALLNEKNMDYAESYTASKSVLKQALSANKDIQFVFDLHRDSQPKETTTKTIDGKKYARLFFVIGGDNPNYEKNLKIATDLDNKLQDKYPGLSRGVITKEGKGTNGVFNQDLSENAVTIEFGGVENKMEELYRTADVLAEIFSDYYWQAEKVQANP